jgi:glutathione S-transferase
VKLYDAAYAPNPRRVRWVMAEKGVQDIEIVQVDLMQGAHRAPELLARIDVAALPALELDDGQVIGESLAICRYLESRYPEPNLFGRDPEEVAVVEMWTRRAELLLANPLAISARHGHPALKAVEPEQIPEVAAFQRGSAERALPLFDQRLGGSRFLAGAQVSIADIVAAIGLDFGRLIRFRVPDSFANLQRWKAEMDARPASKS